ncbi:MAG TPA: hypothetical protein VN493_18950 [Thermoanaerobaculia bacterium]|nr:hypothetical protein [Thermoanaerobaculia bacterium]
MSLALRVEWDRLSKLISGFLEARQLYLNGSDKTSFINGRRQLDKAWKVIVNGLDTFLKRHKMVLPEEAIQSLEGFLGDASGSVLPDPWGLYPMEDRFLAIASIRSVLDFHLADFELLARRLSERAFSHLRRSIVVDEEIKRKWQSAYEIGEVACERLGAVHLLAHGIWAFKVHSSGERTDLVMGDRLRDLTEVEGSAEALVLTEWKKVIGDNAEVCAEEALKQAARYASGSLSGIELHTQRYLVLVSEGVIDIPSPHIDNGVTYKYVNIPVAPLPPSRAKAGRRNGGKLSHNPTDRADGNRKQRGSRRSST